MRTHWLGWGVLALATTMVVDGGAANTVHKTSEICMNAHAILAASMDSDHSRFWEAIGRTAKSPPYEYLVVSDYEPGIAKKVSFRQYDLRFHQGGTAYVAHCGHGGTCNKLAEAFLQNYPEAGSPGVYCGEVPHILDNPQAAPF
jgi:hypothetical protein